jgi:hypothetical protein
MTRCAQFGAFLGRTRELRQLRAAVQKRESLLIWGPMDAGKTALIRAVIAELPEAERRTCLCWAGRASARQLAAHFVGQLFELGDSFVQGKVQADGATKLTLHQWLREQSSLRLRGILITASMRGRYRFFLDHLPAPTHNMARLMKEIMHRCRTPIYLAARGYSRKEIGYAWSLYWNDGLRLRLDPLAGSNAKELLELCIRWFDLASFDLENFREDVLRASGHLPGSIVKMCELAADARYHYGDQIKTELLRVDYLTQSNPRTNLPSTTSRQ